MAWRDNDQAFTVFDARGVVVSTPPGALPSGGTYDVGIGSTSTASQGASRAHIFDPLQSAGSRSSSRGLMLSLPTASAAERPLYTFVVPDLRAIGVDLSTGTPGAYPSLSPEYGSLTPPTPEVICYFQTVIDPSLIDFSTFPPQSEADTGVQHHRVYPPGTSPSPSTLPLHPTGVRRQLRSSGSRENVGQADFTTGSFAPGAREVVFDTVAVQDPHVTQVPDGVGGVLAGKWLMVMTRQRTILGVASTERATVRSLSDIVLYVSDDVTFTSPSGPYLVVDSMNALERFGTGNYPFRVWCSVPSGVVDGDHLLICFMAEPSEVSTTYLSDLGAVTSGAARGPATVRIDLADLEAALGAPPTAETGWEGYYDASAGNAAAVPATPLGPVRIWVSATDNRLGPYDVALTDRFPGMKAADPAIVVTGDASYLALFFSVLTDNDASSPAGWASNSGDTNGQGLWRGSDVSGVMVGSSPTAAIRGVDFVVRCYASGTPFTRGGAPDLVRAANSDDGIVADPDPFECLDGSWIVFHGRSKLNGASAHPTGAVKGGADDVIVPYRLDFDPRIAGPLTLPLVFIP